MAIRVPNYPNKNFEQSSVHLMPHFTVNCPSWWNSHEQPLPESLSKNLSLKVEAPSRDSQEVKYLSFQLQDKDSSSTQSPSQSHHEAVAMGVTGSQDQCISSESVPDECYGKRIEGQMKPVFLMGNPDFAINPSQVDISQSTACIPYPYVDPYLGGLFNAYGPQAIIQPQMVRIAPARVPLPLDIAEDGPIYVNPKQYHGIMRRRQTRAKLEAQNKLVKNRRPYLHESRHIHALNRVRGTGGRFLSKKELQQHKHTHTARSDHASDSVHFNQSGDGSAFEIRRSETGANSADVISQHHQEDHRFSGISSHVGVPMQSTVGLMRSGTQQRVPVVR